MHQERPCVNNSKTCLTKSQSHISLVLIDIGSGGINFLFLRCHMSTATGGNRQQFNETSAIIEKGQRDK